MSENTSVAYEATAQGENDVLQEMRFKAATHELRSQLWQRPQRLGIAAIVCHHLGLRVPKSAKYDFPGKSKKKTRARAKPRAGIRSLEPDLVSIRPPDTWILGSFNLCIPIRVRRSPKETPYTVLMRCPLRHKLAEDRYPGTVEEKMRCEVGAYVWMQENCPEVPIPNLLGFGFPGGLHFTHISSRPFYQRWARSILRFVCTLLHLPVPSSYVRIRKPPGPSVLQHGYLLLEYIEPAGGRMLSETWDAKCHDLAKRRNLFRGLARIILSVARIPHARIGSFTFRNDCTISLSNRPLSCSTVTLENSGASRVIERDKTYPCAEPYISDLLAQHDRRLPAQPNSVKDETDRRQPGLRSQLFAMQFTDFHQSNLFVDDDWNITALVGLEWMCSRPLEMIDVPYWITSKGIDEVGEPEDEALKEYAEARKEFRSILREEEEKLTTTGKWQQNVLPSDAIQST
ncbi:uncharacterized protein B0H64DRAFT_189728 [Chaetomium fimeti]|uniref:Aminoglycoside phosphotransferase domain-containing protein n=1 Tax=Chaetomium fimeti TaxID=1854472 RepID=A0AAE0HDH6_9PEZI|nr:hypothetical protein B0H64DRAFT_189728 [Chaetomium fimeti]